MFKHLEEVGYRRQKVISHLTTPPSHVLFYKYSLDFFDLVKINESINVIDSDIYVYF